jgi:CRISPR-associated protein Cas5t
MVIPNGTPKLVAKVTIEAPVVSFRYPHFLIGRQPTFDMPPPSTIFGHIASALGEWPRTALRFAYFFRCGGRAGDLEHQQIISRTSGKFPGDLVDPLWRPPDPEPGKKLKKSALQPRLLQKTTEAVVQPHQRDFLFDARLELYLDPPELAAAFRSPAFTVVLGRSQDLASVKRVEVVELPTATNGYVERTILPATLRPRLPWGVTTLMPRYIGPPPERQSVFAPYIVLQERIYVGDEAKSQSKKLIGITGEPENNWFVDPSTPEDRVGRRLLWFHTLDPAEFGDDKLE